MKHIRRLWKDERGQDLTEYGLLAAFVSITAVVTIRTIGPLVTPLYERVHGAF